MNQPSMQREKAIPYYKWQSYYHPQPSLPLLAVNQKGTGQIIDINRDGLSFGCLYPHTFPQQWELGILNAKGSHIKDVSVRKIWELNTCDSEFSTGFALMVGVEFIDLADSQKNALEQLLRQTFQEFHILCSSH